MLSGGACADIPGANASRYLLVAADGGRTMRVVVTATNSVSSTSATSAPSNVISRSGKQVRARRTTPVTPAVLYP